MPAIVEKIRGESSSNTIWSGDRSYPDQQAERQGSTLTLHRVPMSDMPDLVAHQVGELRFALEAGQQSPGHEDLSPRKSERVDV